MLKIENIDKLPLASMRNDCKCMDYNIHPNMYEFIIKHRHFNGEFRYLLMRDMGNGKGNRYFGTFRHPHGSNRQDCYDSDILNPESFLNFMDTLIVNWFVKYNQ